MAPVKLAQQFQAAVTRAVTAGSASAFSRMMMGDKGMSPETIRDGVSAAFGTLDPQVNGRSVFTPRARTAVVDALAVVSFNIGAAMARQETA